MSGPGSESDVSAALVDVRSTPTSRHRLARPPLPESANIGSASHQFIVVVTRFISSGPTKVLVVMRPPAATMLACVTKPNPGQVDAKIAQAAAGRRSSNTASRRRRGRRVNNRKSFSFSSEAFAGMRITYRHQKEAEPESQHDDIQHEMLLVALVSVRDVCASRQGRF